MRAESRTFFAVFSLFLIVSMVSGGDQSLDLEIKASLSGSLDTPSLYLQTRLNASSDFDFYDQPLPKRISGLLFYSKIEDSNLDNQMLNIDVWDAIQDFNRILELRFQGSDVGTTGLLNFVWDSDDLVDSKGRYFFTLKDYGGNSLMNGDFNEVDMNNQNSYSVENNVSVRYFKLESVYEYCGDGIKQSWEVCDGVDFGGEDCPIEGGYLVCTSSCQIDPSYCPTCGDGSVQTGLGEECDWDSVPDDPLFSSSKDDCIKLNEGFSGGTLGCFVPGNSNQCKLDKSSCFFPDGSSPSGSSGGGGGGLSCKDECIIGQRRCLSALNYQVCGDFNNDGCSEWAVSETCLGVNPVCKNGFCFGCITDSDCSGGWCVNGKCETDCGKSCEELGLQCGKVNLCGELLNCGSCNEPFFCNSGSCSKIPENAFSISEENCSPDYSCSPWSSCKVSFDSVELISGNQWFSGKRDRLCFDKNNCYSTLRELEECSLMMEIELKETEICGIKYLEIYEKSSENLLARMRDLRYQMSKSIEVFLLPGDINCVEDRTPIKLSFFDHLFSYLDLRNFWRLFQ